MGIASRLEGTRATTPPISPPRCAAPPRRQGMTPHVAQNTKGRQSAIGRRTTCHRRTARVGWMFTIAAAAYNRVRLPRLLGAVA